MANAYHISSLKKLLLREHKSASWRKLGIRYGIAFGTLQRIATDPTYEPKDLNIRRKLRLPLRCPDCHRRIVAVDESGKAYRPRWRSLAETPPELIRWMLEHREVMP